MFVFPFSRWKKKTTKHFVFIFVSVHTFLHHRTLTTSIVCSFVVIDSLQESSIRQNGTVWSVADLLRLPGPLPQPEIVTMSTLVLHGALYGGPHQLRHSPGITNNIYTSVTQNVYSNIIHLPLKLFKQLLNTFIIQTIVNILGKMSGMQSRASNPLSRDRGLSNQRYIATVSRASHRDHRRVARPHQRSGKNINKLVNVDGPPRLINTLLC